MDLNCNFLSEKDKYEICSWKYKNEYEVYNLPSYEEMKEKRMGFMNPKYEHNFKGYYINGQLIGFTNIFEEENEVFIGIGVHPKHCNFGYGSTMLENTYLISKEMYPNKPLYLEVRTWNKRAIRCYQKAGFEIEGEPFEQQTHMGLGTFYRMIRK